MNIHFLKLVFGFILINTTVYASELIIEVTTDKYPNETSWKVFDTQKNLILENGTLLKNTTYRDTLEIPSDACYFWRIYDSYGNGMSNGTPPGDFKIFIDGTLVDFCENPDFGDSLTIYGLGSGCMATDVSLESIDISENQSFSPFNVIFTLLNFGSETITSLQIGYQLGGWEYEPVLLEDLSIEFGQTVQLVLPEKLKLTSAGEYIFGLNIQKVNGQNDLNISNNYLEKTINVALGYWQKPLHEEFTANWCGPCALANPVLKATFDQFPGLYSLIKYQYYNDTYYHTDGGRMASFYNVAGVPAMYINGLYFYPGDYTPEEFLSHTGKISPAFISMDPEAIGDSLIVKITITTLENFNSSAYLRLAVVENQTTGNMGTNGEEEFENVFMKFLTNWNGDEIGKLQTNQTFESTYKIKLTDTFIEEMNDLSVIGYLFYKGDYSVLQSEMVTVPYKPSAPVIVFSIENGSIEVDTVVTITIESDKTLIHSDNSEITDIQSVITFHEQNPDGAEVAFTGNISNSKKVITINPFSNLMPGTTYLVRLSGVKSVDGAGVINAQLTFTTKNRVGISGSENILFKVFPNPVTNQLTFIADEAVEVFLIDAMGKIVFSLEQITGTKHWDVSALKTGIYFIKTKSLTQTNFYKILKY